MNLKDKPTTDFKTCTHCKRRFMRKYFENKSYFFNEKKTCSRECRDASKVGVAWRGPRRNRYERRVAVFNITPDGGMTFKQIATELGMSRELARLICKQALSKLRKHLVND